MVVGKEAVAVAEAVAVEVLMAVDKVVGKEAVAVEVLMAVDKVVGKEAVAVAVKVAQISPIKGFYVEFPSE